MTLVEQSKVIEKFEQSDFGIITCVYCLGEGWDFPLLDAVVFSENMTSVIRIVQSALRASRKNIKEPNKIAKIILPILDKDDWLENTNNVDMKKIREVIYHMGLEDETIIQKIKVFRIVIEKHKRKPKENIDECDNYIGEYDPELTLKLKLKTTKRTSLGLTYEKSKKIIAEKHIKSKEEYYDLCERDIRFSKEPEIIFKGLFTNWIEYLSIEKKLYYNLDECISKVSEYVLCEPKLREHFLDLSFINIQLCKMDVKFPPNGLWVDFYNIKDLGEIIKLSNKRKKISSELL
jgi:hypothetical protein